MKHFLTPEPVVVELRNAAGFVTVDLTDDVTTSTVDVTRLPAGSGLLDDLVSAFRRTDAAGSPGTSGADTVDAADEVRIDLRVTEQGSVLIVDTEANLAEFGPVGRWGSTPAYGVRIVAPRGSGLRTKTRSADVTVTGVADRLDVRSASGDVVADVVRRASLVQTASGDIRLSTLGADAEVRTASGDVVIERVAGSISVHSTSGDVRIEEPAGDVFVRSVSGDVRILDAVDGAVQATAVSGDVEVGVHRGALAKINLSTVSGSTLNDFEVMDDPADLPGVGADAGPGTVDHQVDLGKPGSADAAEPAATAGRLEITCRTTSGDIRLRRAVGARV